MPQRVAHFGRDYDGPGSMTRCHACSMTTSDPVVAFVCTQCTTRTLADVMPAYDVMSAQLTDTGRAYVTSGETFAGPARATLQFGDFPLELTIALNRAAKAFNQDETPFTLGYIRHDRLGDIKSAREGRDARKIWLERFQSALDDTAVVATGRAHDFFLMNQIAADGAVEALDTAKQEADAVVRFDLGSHFQLFGPADFAQ